MKKKKPKWHCNKDCNYMSLLCGTDITLKTMLAYDEKSVTCKRCKKIIKKEDAWIDKYNRTHESKIILGKEK